MTSTPQRRTLAEAIRRAVALGLADAHVSLPARVTRVDLAAGLIDAQPLVMDLVEDGAGGRRAVALPVVTNVPIQVANGGGFRITFPVAVGDVCTLLFADRSIDVWMAKGGGPVDPIDPRTHALSDAVVAIPSTNPAQPWTIDAAAMTLGKEGGTHQVVVKDGEIDLGTGAGLEGVGMGAKLRTELDALWTAITGHVHVLTIAAASGSGGTGTAAPATYVATKQVVESATVKAKP